MAEHHMPVLVAEFGIPVSRGMTHANIYTGFDQGNKSETQQGEMLVSMMEDIYDTGYAGGIEKKVRLLTMEKADMSAFFVPKKGTAL